MPARPSPITGSARALPLSRPLSRHLALRRHRQHHPVRGGGDGRARRSRLCEGEVHEPLLVRVAVPGDRLILVVGRNPRGPKSPPSPPRCSRSPPGCCGRRGRARAGVRGCLPAAWHRSPPARRGAGIPLERSGLSAPSRRGRRNRHFRAGGAGGPFHRRAGSGPFEVGERPFFVLRHADRYRSRAENALLDMVRADQPAGASLAGTSAGGS